MPRHWKRVGPERAPIVPSYFGVDQSRLPLWEEGYLSRGQREGAMIDGRVRGGRRSFLVQVSNGSFLIGTNTEMAGALAIGVA